MTFFYQDSPYKRFLLTAHRPDDLEREEQYRASAFAALESEFGPRQWDASLAILAEGESEEVDRYHAVSEEPDGLTLQEIGEEFGISRERVRCIIVKAMAKLRREPVIRELAKVRW